ALAKDAARRAEAERLYRQARDLLQKLTTDFPGEPKYHAVLGGALCNLAGFLTKETELSDKRRLLAEAVGHGPAALQAKPQPPFYRRDMAVQYRNLASTLLRLREYAAAYRLYADAFANLPELANDLQNQPRYDAACAATLAGCGQGNDAAQSDAMERGRLRQ